jgi:type II secretory pathway pseudopilin PulG
MRPTTGRNKISTSVLLAILALLALLFSQSAYGQDASQTTNDQKIQQLMQQVQQLQAQMKALQAQQSNAVAAAPPPVVPPAAAPAPVAEPIQETYTPPLGIKLRLFGDVGFDDSTLKGTTDSFYVGSLDMFMTGQLTDRVSALGEVLFTTSSVDNSISPDVERLLLTYRQNDHLKASIGRYHTSIGYYDPTFHRGEWFQTAIGPPFMYAFDDEGGAFPLQEVGAQLSGQLPSGRLGLEYIAEVGNGANHFLGAEIAQNDHDTNNGKSFNLGLSAHPSRFPGLDVGFSVYHDYLTFAGLLPNHSELISTVYVVYTNSKYEILNEGEVTRHVGTIDGGPGTFNTPAFYTQFSRGFGKYRPYFRYQYFNAGATDPIYGNPALGLSLGRRNGPSLGLRFDFNDHAAVKFQYDHFDFRGLETGNPYAVQTSNGIVAEFSFAY